MIVILGKSGCGKCEAAKGKMALLGMEYAYVELDTGAGRDHEAADDALSIAIAAGLNITTDIPIIVIDAMAYKYAEAMKELKARKS